MPSHRKQLACLMLAFLLLGLFCPEATAQQDDDDRIAADGEENATDQTKKATSLEAVPDKDAKGADILEHARNLFEYGDYPKMIGALEFGLENDRFSKEQSVDVNRLLGIGYFILQDKRRSREHLLILLTQQPEIELDPLWVPPIIVEFFERIREDNKQMLAAIQQQRLLEKKEEQERQQQAAGPRIVRISRPYFVNYIPFGAGQFQNGDMIKGTLFLTGQTVALALNVTGFFVSRSLEGDDGQYSPGDAAQARDWRIVQYAALGAFAALIIGGIVDAVLSWEQYEDQPAENGTVIDTPAQTPAEDTAPKLELGAMRLRF